MKTTLRLIAVLTLATPVAHAANYTVPGTSNPWLAGWPAGTTANGGSPNAGDVDTAPFHSPVLIDVTTGFLITPSAWLSFTASGGVNNNFFGPGDGPDGGTDGVVDFQPHVPENGIAGYGAQINSLVGVFLSPLQPNPGSEPIAFDYLPTANSFQPGLAQVFFIGDGLTGTGSGMMQQFQVPSGATRLFLGTIDGHGWNNNFGSFNVVVVPEPSTWALLALGVGALAFGCRRRRRPPAA